MRCQSSFGACWPSEDVTGLPGSETLVEIDASCESCILYTNGDPEYPSLLYEIDGSGSTSKRCPDEWFNGHSVPFIVHAHVRKCPFVLCSEGSNGGFSSLHDLLTEITRCIPAVCLLFGSDEQCISDYVVHSEAPDSSGRPISRIVIDDQRRVRPHMHSFLDVHPSRTSPFGALLDPCCSI